MVTDTYKYDAFGAAAHTGASANYWQFAGEQTDAASGMQYLRARYYDPSLGRFMTRDAASARQTQPQTWNQYAYALNNPTSRVDPTGMDSETIVNCISFGLILAAFLSAILITNPITSLYVGLAFLTVAIAIDLYTQDDFGVGLDVGTAGANIAVLGLQAAIQRRFALHTFIPDLAYTGGSCISGIQSR